MRKGKRQRTLKMRDLKIGSQCTDKLCQLEVMKLMCFEQTLNLIVQNVEAIGILKLGAFSSCTTNIPTDYLEKIKKENLLPSLILNLVPSSPNTSLSMTTLSESLVRCANTVKPFQMHRSSMMTFNILSAISQFHVSLTESFQETKLLGLNLKNFSHTN